MKTKEVRLPTGQKFTVPQGIQRLDSHSTRGWQVRYHGTKYFADGAAGPANSLTGATKELLQRIATMPAPVTLRKAASPNKGTGLPPGISGPIVVKKAGSGTPTAVLSVLVPRYGETNLVKNIYLGTPRTYTKKRYNEAVAEAVQMRAEAVAEYEATATRVKRKEATAMKKLIGAVATGRK
jgi:hypothetical protein